MYIISVGTFCTFMDLYHFFIYYSACFLVSFSFESSLGMAFWCSFFISCSFFYFSFSIVIIYLFFSSLIYLSLYFWQ